MLSAFFVLIEVVWLSCEPFQRQQLLEAMGRDDLARELQLDPYYPFLNQLYQLRLEDHDRALEEIQQEQEAEQKLKREKFRKLEHTEQKPDVQKQDGQSAEHDLAFDWQSTGITRQKCFVVSRTLKISIT
jgi:hypothetical protein